MFIWTEHILASLSSQYFQGLLSIQADYVSREQLLPEEWSLYTDVLFQIDDIFGPLEINIFASQTDNKLYQQAPLIEGINALRSPWPPVLLCLSMSLLLLARVLLKVRLE